MLRLSSIAGALIVLGGASALPTAAQQVPAAVADSGVFIVLHGHDTVASERFNRTDTELYGTLAFTDAAHGLQQYKAVIGPDGTLPLVEVTVRGQPDSNAQAVEGRVVQRARVIFKEDSAAVDALTDHGIETRLFGTQRGALPYLNLSFALLEQAVRRGHVAGTSADVPFFSLGGGQTVVGKLASVGADSVALTIGEVEFRLCIDRAGRILGGRIPKQDVVVKRS